MNKKTVGIALVVIIAITGLFFPRGGTVVEKVVEKVADLGALTGPDIFDKVRLHDGVEIGGGNFATSSAGAVTYTADQLFNFNLVTHTATGALTATLPASSTIPYIRDAGDSTSVFITPVTTGITLAGGTGTELSSASSTSFCVVGTICRLDFIRKANTDIEVFLTSADQ